jgi:hypothetical protein
MSDPTPPSNQLNDAIDILRQGTARHLDARLEIAAASDAIAQLLSEIEGRTGVSAEVLSQRFLAARDWYKDARYREASDKIPNLAARADTRELSEIPTSDRPPVILPPEE